MKALFRCQFLFKEGEWKENCTLIVEEGILKEIVYGSETLRGIKGFERYELNGAVIPSLVNGHTHLELTDTTTKIKRKSLSLWDWILQIVREKRSLGEADFLKNIERGENLSVNQGVSIVGDVRSVLPNKPAFQQLKGVIFFEVLGYQKELFEKKMDMFLEFLDHCKDLEGLRPGLSIHSLYTTPFTKAKELVKFARQRGLPIMLHLGETLWEDRLFFQRDVSGFKKVFPNVDFEDLSFKSYAEIIDFLDLKEDSFLVHCVTFKKEDWQKVEERGIKVVFCPRSNLFWDDLLPDFEEVIKRDIEFLLGTDSIKTNEDLVLLKEARLMYKKVAHLGGGAKVLSAITEGGRRALKEDGMGLKEGDRVSFLWFPLRGKKRLDLMDIFSEDVEPRVYFKEGFLNEGVKESKK